LPGNAELLLDYQVWLFCKLFFEAFRFCRVVFSMDLFHLQAIGYSYLVVLNGWIDM